MITNRCLSPARRTVLRRPALVAALCGIVLLPARAQDITGTWELKRLQYVFMELAPNSAGTGTQMVIRSEGTLPAAGTWLLSPATNGPLGTLNWSNIAWTVDGRVVYSFPASVPWQFPEPAAPDPASECSIAVTGTFVDPRTPAAPPEEPLPPLIFETYITSTFVNWGPGPPLPPSYIDPLQFPGWRTLIWNWNGIGPDLRASDRRLTRGQETATASAAWKASVANASVQDHRTIVVEFHGPPFDGGSASYRALFLYPFYERTEKLEKIVVDTLEDVDDGIYTEGKQSLREAIKRAGQMTSAVDIDVEVSGTIRLKEDIFLEGPNARRVRLVAKDGPLTLTNTADFRDTAMLGTGDGNNLFIDGVRFAPVPGPLPQSETFFPQLIIQSSGKLRLQRCEFAGHPQLAGGVLVTGPLEADLCLFGGETFKLGMIGSVAKIDLKVTNCLFTGEAADQSAGVVAGLANTFVRAEIRDCEFVAKSGRMLAIDARWYDNPVKVQDCQFRVTGGNAIFAGTQEHEAQIEFKHCLFESAQPTSWPFLEIGSGSKMTARDCVFLRTGDFPLGGPLVKTWAHPSIPDLPGEFSAVNCLFSSPAGGLDLNGLGYLQHCTLFCKQRALMARPASRTTLGHCIIAGSRSWPGNEGQVLDLDLEPGAVITSAGFNAVESPPAAFTLPGTTLGKRLSLARATDGGVVLMAYSLCVNAGDPAFAPDFFSPHLLEDISGLPRVARRIDLGAMEVREDILDLLDQVKSDPVKDENGNGVLDLVDALAGIDPSSDAASDPPVTVQPGAPAAAAAPRAPRDNPSGTIIIETRIDERAHSLEGILQTSTDLVNWTDRAVYRPDGAGEGYTRTGQPGAAFVSHEQTGWCWLVREQVAFTGGRLYVRLKAAVIPEGDQ